MSVTSGRPTLAALYPHDVPAIPAMYAALRGKYAARAAVYALATRHDLAQQLAFQQSVRDAQTHPLDGYTAAFKAAAFEALAELLVDLTVPEDERDGLEAARDAAAELFARGA